MSHCETQSQRLEYANEMNKYVPVDVYGACGPNKCPMKDENRFLSKACREHLSREYMFFLSFENSFCDDYVTEKLFDSILYDSIPVVLGIGNYEKWLPKSAYINALDFQSPRHLSNYLLYLSKNATAYNSYFKWKKYIQFTNNEYKSFCDMCIKLHLEDYFGIEKSIIKDLAWEQKRNCKSPVFGNDSFELAPLKKDVICDFCW